MLVLASTSPYRRQMMERLRLPFEIARPEVDEAPLARETPASQAARLASDKARDVGRRYRDAWIIGSDQTAELEGQALGKPGTFERAADQLAAASGKEVSFHTAVTLYRHVDRRSTHFLDLTVVRFRRLQSAEIERYLHAEQPYDCAGSFKAEGLGICLFESIQTHDPTALIGMPMIALCDALRKVGYTLP